MQRLFRRYARFRDQAARDELFERFLPLARGLARRYHRGTEPLDDLVQVASIGLLGAIERFDPERGREFTTYAIPTITGELKRYYRDYGWALKVTRAEKDRLVCVSRCIEEIAARRGRSPTPRELAEHAQLSVDEVIRALELADAAWPASLDEIAPDRGAADSPLDDAAGGPDEEPRTLGETIGFEDPGLDLVECRDLVTRSVRALTPREHRVLYLRFVEDLTQLQIGAHVGLSQMQVSRILRSALERSAASAGGTRVPSSS